MKLSNKDILLIGSVVNYLRRTTGINISVKSVIKRAKYLNCFVDVKEIIEDLYLIKEDIQENPEFKEFYNFY